MLPSKIRAVYFKELRDALRDRRTMFATVIVPILLYPIMLLGTAEVSQQARAQLDREKYAVAIPPGSAPLFERLSVLPDAQEADGAGGPERVDAAEASEPRKPAAALPGQTALPKPALNFEELPPDEAERQLRAGMIRAVVLLPNDFEKRVAAREALSVEVKYDRAEHRSLDACSRLQKIFDAYSASVVNQRLETEHLRRVFLKPFTLSLVNVAAAEKVGGSVLGSFLPLIFIMMIITGAMHPAIDMTAGEKERSTLETLVGAPVRAFDIISGKFLAVATLALGNAVLNVGSFGLTFSLLPLPSSGFAFPWAALPAALLLLAPLTLFFAGLLLAAASLAANQKEAQIYCLPIYLVPVMGMMIVMMPVELEGPLLLIPVVNTALLIKQLFLGHGTAEQMAFVFCSTSLYAAGTVVLAARLFAREEVLFSTQASFRLFLNRRFFKPGLLPKPGDALLVLALIFPVNFYVQSGLVKALTAQGAQVISPGVLSAVVLIPQYGLFLAMPLLAAWYLKLDLRKTFLWRLPSPSAAAGGLLLGCGAWLVIQQLIAWQSIVWPMGPAGEDALSKSLAPFAETLPGQAWMIMLIGVTPAICEEHLFRGFLLQGMHGAGKWAGIAVVGVLFGLYHVTLFNQPVLMLMGMVLAYAAYETRSIWPGVLMHFVYNSLNILGPVLVSLADVEMHKPKAGEPLPNIPLQLLVPSVVLFAAGLWLVRRRAPAIDD